MDQLTLALERGLARLEWLRPAAEHMRIAMAMTHRKLLDVIRDTRKTLYVVAAFYVAVGFIFTIVSLAAGALLGTFLGFLIISGTLASAAILRAVLRTDLRVSTMNETLGCMADRLDRIEDAIIEARRAFSDRAHTDVVDLATGRPQTAGITAATLERNVFPRMVTGREDVTSVRSMEMPASSARASSRSNVGVHRMWEKALDDGNLAAARRAFSAMVDAAEPESVDDMRASLVDLERRTERSLRRTVTECVTVRDVDGLLEVLGEIRIQLPGHAMVDECTRLEAALHRRTANEPRRGAREASIVRDETDDDEPTDNDHQAGGERPALRFARIPS